MSIQTLQQLNPAIKIHMTYSNAFKPYGRRIEIVETDDLYQYGLDHIVIPNEGNKYIASMPELEKLGAVKRIQDCIYGQMPIEAGVCAGQNTLLTGIEYHQGSETIVGITDCVLILGKQQDMVDYTYETSLVEYFYLKAGETVELYSTTLHYTPCKVTNSGFATICILPQGTNTACAPSNNPLLTKTNKFFIAHPSQKEKIAAGAVAGLIGSMPEIKPISLL
jgi:hypothetical protein